MAEVVVRVGDTIEQLAREHRGGDVVCIATAAPYALPSPTPWGVGAGAALHVSVQNLSLTILERHAEGWRIVVVNEGWSGI